MLYDCGLLDLVAAQFGPVNLCGSLALNLMTWPDVDLDISLSRREGARLLALAPLLLSQMERHGWRLTRAVFNNEYHQPRNSSGNGLYAGYYLLSPSAEEWKIDLWGWEEPEFAIRAERHAQLRQALEGIDRATLLDLKTQLYDRPGFRKAYGSLPIYAFAIQQVGETVEEFEWFLPHYQARQGQ